MAKEAKQNKKTEGIKFREGEKETKGSVWVCMWQCLADMSANIRSMWVHHRVTMP